MANDNRVLYRRAFPTAHKIVLERVIAPKLSTVKGDVLVIGAGKEPYRALMPSAASIVCTDIEAGEHIDLVADAHNLPFPSGTFDAVIAIEVFEHLHDPRGAMLEVNRVLRPKGRILLSVPFMFRVHGDPHDYQRFTASGLSVLFKEHFDLSILPFGNRLQVISDLVTTAFRGLAALRIFNHILAIGLFAKASRDCPSGYLLEATKKNG